MTVTLTYATGRGHALIGRALYLPEGCAADEEHRELAGVPEEVMFATKRQLAGDLLDRAHALGIRAAFVAGDEVYGGRELRRGIRQREMGYVMAVRANHALTTGSGRTVTAAAAIRMIPAHAWHRMRTGSGTKGTRHYDWAMLEVTSDDTPGGHDGGHSVLLARRHRLLLSGGLGSRRSVRTLARAMILAGALVIRPIFGQYYGDPTSPATYSQNLPLTAIECVSPVM